MKTLLSKHYEKAKSEGRLCERCGWMITKPRYKAGHRICWYCEDAAMGVNINYGFGRYLDEPLDKTGESL